ncbi:hypothetical protein BRARA_B02153 [Brassica rapa]|uniref:Uncharacterized protein n=1 Tax=Brassica campestris TaxID=3711 RepID=A0A398ABD6_BRACM|nr:hypothetical protein BRARA_B02153 [Brassica rapa]
MHAKKVSLHKDYELVLNLLNGNNDHKLCKLIGKSCSHGFIKGLREVFRQRLHLNQINYLHTALKVQHPRLKKTKVFVPSACKKGL